MPQPRDIHIESGGMKYRVMTLPDFRRFKELVFSEGPEWTTHYTDEKITVQSKPPGDDSTKLNIIRARCIMKNVPPLVLYDQLQDARYRATWDENMIEGFNIVQLDSHNDIGYYSAKFPWPLANRDFCNLRSWMEFTNGEYVIFNHSEPHSTCPVKKDFVRARSILTGYYMQPHESGGTLLTYVTHSDPCGSIPHAVINFAMKKGSKIILGKCEKYSELYPQFVSETYPKGHVFSWRTPKISWESKYLNPEDERLALEKEKETNAAVAEDNTVRDAKEISKLNEGTPGASPRPMIGGVSPTVSLAPAGPMLSQDPAYIQKYRSIMQDALDTVDRSFIREGRAPTTREYVVRLKYILLGIRATS